MKNKVILGIVILIALASVWFLFSNQAQKVASNDQTIKIGAILALTGDGSTDGQNIKRGMELAKDDLAEQGTKVEINYQDDKTNPKESVSAVQYLAENYKPNALVGPIWSFLEDAAAPVITQNKLVTYSPADTSEIVNTKSPYIFHGTIKNSEKAEPVANWLKVNGKKRVAIIVSQDAWGNSHEQAYRQAAKLAEAQVVMVEKLPFGLEDAGLSTVLLKVKNSGADVLLWTGYNDGALSLIRKTSELNIDIPIIGTEGFSWVVKAGLVKPSSKQEIYSLKTKLDPKFVQKFEAKFGEEPGTYADTAYDGLMILAQSIREGKKNGYNLQSYLKNKLSYDGFAGHYHFDSNNDREKGGEWVLERVR